MEYKEPEPNIVGFMNGNELEWLYQKAKECESVVEIGCWIGRSTHALLSGCKGTVWAVDHFQGNPTQNHETGPHGAARQRDISIDFMKNVGQFSNLKLLKMDSVEASKLFLPKSVDMVFIDGNHELFPFKQDYIAWEPICKRLLCGHDLEEGGVKAALEEMNVNFVKVCCSIWERR